MSLPSNYTPQSRVEEILVAMINGEEYTKFPESRIEALLIELLGKIIEVEGRGAYEFKGSVDFDELPETLTEDMAGWTYNMAESFTTDSRFVDGAGKSYPQGTNVSVANVGTDDDPIMMFDVPSAFVDVSAIYNTIATVVANLAEEFDPDETYEEGDFVTKDDVLYRFISDHTASDPWLTMEVEAVTLSSLLFEIYTSLALKANATDIPTNLSDLTEDTDHRTVTDTEKSEWNSKQSNVNLTLTPDAVVSDRDVTDGSGNTLSVVADSVSTPKTVTGNPVIVEDALESNADGLVAKIVPIQDLHGYDKPWSGGSGKNKLPLLAVTRTVNGLTFTVNNDGTITINGTATDLTYLVFDNANNILNNLSQILFSAGTSIIGSSGIAGKILSIRYTDGNYASMSDNTVFTPDKDISHVYIQYASGTTLNNVIVKPMIRLASVSDATFEPWENKCPISGRTEVNLGRSGKNLMPLTVATIKASNGGASSWTGNTKRIQDVDVTIYEDDAGNCTGILLNGTPQGQFVFKLYDRAVYTSELKLNGCPSGGTTNTYLLQMYNVTDQTYTNMPIDVGEGADFTPDSSKEYHTVIVVRANQRADNLLFKPMLRLSTVSDATFAPYTDVTFTFALGTTVYFGFLNVLTGVLTITHKMVVLDSVDKLTGFATSAEYGSYAYVIGTTDAKTDSAEVLGLCSKASYVSFNNRLTSKDKNRVWSDTNNTQVYIRAAYTETVATIADLFALFEDAQICYELATPQTVQLTPSQFALLMGYNRITSDSGELTLTYKANAVQAKADEIQITTNIEMGTKASKAYTVNQFMLRSDGLYKVTANIASGATLTSSNTTKVTITEVLTALLNA